jgi:hypothetical protein
MKTHVESAHPKLVVYKKLAIAEEFLNANHNQQLRKKQYGLFGFVVTTYFGVKNPYKKYDGAQQ